MASLSAAAHPLGTFSVLDGKRMINLLEIPEFKKAVPIIDRFEQHGFEAYFVGGGVRDTLLHLPISDVDIASSATPEEIQDIFPITFDVGIKHGTVMVLHERETYEVTTFRTESKYEKFRRPEKVEYVRSLEEDLKRRDFTINAIALDRNGNLEDPFEGQKDIERKLIRAVGNPEERFREDALRMMRAARFMSQLGFDVEEKTKNAVEDYHPLLSKIAVERIRDEWTKLLVGRNRKGGLRFFVETRLFQMCPGLQNQDEKLIDLALFPIQFQTPLIAWTVLLHFLDVPFEKLDTFLRSWKLSKKEMESIKKAYQALQVRLERHWDNQLLFKTGIKIALEVEEILTGFGLVSEINRLLTMDKQLPIHSTHEIQIDGKEIMELLGFHRGGPYLGKILNDIQTRILTGKLLNEKETIRQFIQRRRMIYLDEVRQMNYTVKANETAAAMGSGDLEVLATPALIAYMENACKEMMKSLLESQQTSLGVQINVTHSAPSLPGAIITIETRMKELNGNRYSFSIVAKDQDQIIALGEHTRAIVNTKEFMKKLTKE